jgi:hypothetical protein
MTAPVRSSGITSSDLEDGLEQDRLGLRCGVAEPEDPGHLEGRVRRVDRVVLAVEHPRSDVDDGIPSDRSLTHRLDDPLLHRRQVAGRDDPAD